jgi:hypothetical protein
MHKEITHTIVNIKMLMDASVNANPDGLAIHMESFTNTSVIPNVGEVIKTTINKNVMFFRVVKRNFEIKQYESNFEKYMVCELICAIIGLDKTENDENNSC